MKKRSIVVISVLMIVVPSLWVVFNRVDQASPDSGTSSIGSDEKAIVPMVTPQNNQIMPRPTQHNAKQPSKAASELAAGGRSWGLNFADQSLPEAMRQRIAYDLNLVLGHLQSFEIDTLPFHIEVDGRQLDRRVRFEGEGRKWNNAFQADEFGCLFRGASESEIYVPTSLIEAYRKAIELENQHQAEFQQLDQLLARMNELKERPIENVRDLFVIADDFKNAEADLAAIPPDGFAEAWGGKHYREPSILDVTATVGTPFEKYGSLVATTYAMTSSKMNDLPLLVFNQGRWRFLLQRPPT